MDSLDNGIARRSVLISAEIGLGAGLVSGLSAASARTASAAAAGKIWSAEYWAHKDSVKLNLWRKRVGLPFAGRIEAAKTGYRPQFSP